MNKYELEYAFITDFTYFAKIVLFETTISFQLAFYALLEHGS